MNDKILLTNRKALQKKYGAALPAVDAAVTRLIAADQARGLHTRIVHVDDPAEMHAVHGLPVTNPTSPSQNKRAVDAVYKALTPDYLVLLGSIDIIPHQDLRNPLYDPQDPTKDADEFAYGDIPYACEAAYSRNPQKFIGPTRVVGRLPDVTGSHDPAYLVGLLDTASSWASKPRADYQSHLGISAEVWKESTASSLMGVFGSNQDLQVSPPAGPRWSPALLTRLSHFINCHGSPSTPVFFGQPEGQELYPDAHRADWIDGRVSPGTIVAAECCYGAELYDPAVLPTPQIGIANTYLANKAYGFFGSSTIAYGPSSGNACADLICAYFVRRVLAGASLGRAALEARQQFAQSSPTLGPDDIKTLAQYNLLADPSIQPVILPALHAPLGMKKAVVGLASSESVASEDRAARRRNLLVKGTAIAQTQSFAVERTKIPHTETIRSALQTMARQERMVSPTFLSFRIDYPAFTRNKSRRALAEKISEPTVIHVAIARADRPATVLPAAGITLLVMKEEAGQIVSVRRLHSR